MKNNETPSVDKQIAAKMFSSAKLKRLRNYEQRKIDKERNLMVLKRTTLPVLEADFIRRKESKCKNCNKDNEHYGITFEWHLEPVEILKMKTNKGFYGLNKYDRTRRLLSSMMKALVINPASIKMLKYLQTQKSDMPIIYVLKSKDYELDEMILNFILKSYDLKNALSITAAATAELNENLIREYLSANESLILFINDESQMEMLFKATEYGERKQVYMMPVSIGCEIKNSTKFKPSIFSFSHPNYGIVKVSLHEPYTFRDLLQWAKEDITKTGAIYEHLLHDIVFKRPVLSTDIVAYLLLTQFRKGGTLEEFSTRINEIRNTNPNIDFAFDGDASDIVVYALKILDKKIAINEDLVIRPLENSANLIDLWDYAETLICNFAFHSALILSAEHLKRVDVHVDYNKMINLAVDLCDIVQLEIPVYKACSDIKIQLGTAFDELSRKDMLTRPVENYTETEMRARKIAEHLDTIESDNDYYYDEYNEYYDDDDDEFSDPNNRITINVDKQEEINVLKDALLPIQESYMNVAYCLKRMIGNEMLQKDEFLKISMDAMKDECFSEGCKYWESCSNKWMENCLKLFELWGVVSKVPFTNDYYFINKKFKDEEEIHKIAKHIEQFSDY